MSTIEPCDTTPQGTTCQEKTAQKPGAFLRPLVIALAIPLGFFLIEYPSNDLLATMDIYYVVVNVIVIAVLFAIVYTLGQRSRIAVVAFLAVCLLIGTANHFVILFKGQPVVPADLFALSTAASVSSGYSFALDGRLLACIVAFVLYCVALAFVPRITLKVRRVVAQTLVGILLVGCFGWWMSACDLGKTYNCTVDVWGVKESYASQGTALCFLKRVQDLSPNRPEGYDAQAVDNLLAPYRSTADVPYSADDEAAPTVIVIMNETFADLSRYPGLANTDARPATYYEVAASSLDSGDAYVSALGGGTCNSEFEFLTGSSMGHLGGGVYPYVLYDLDGTESLVSYFSSLGYATHAIHPAESTNWRRDRIYAQLGFDTFADISSFDEADTLRDLVTDRATYDYVLDLVENSEKPQFIFDVTIQNHGGYDTGALADDMRVSVPLPDGSASAELDEYLSCIRQADRDLAYLTEQLNALDRPVVLCFFGDHQPGLSDWLFETTHDGSTADELGLAAVQERYTVPYLIWANDTAHERCALDEPATENTSLNYLGAKVIETSGLPLTAYQRFLLATSERIPAINLNGFLTADGTWHWFGEQTDADDALSSYAIVQYDNLFNKQSEWTEN